ncbi:MAG: hypothetical protein DMG09_16430 [Acidobacteria bacterium]|nr:MAG: hypothetical protein DMG09_16430 [Acidobacteriota bacterium]
MSEKIRLIPEIRGKSFRRSRNSRGYIKKGLTNCFTRNRASIMTADCRSQRVQQPGRSMAARRKKRSQSKELYYAGVLVAVLVFGYSSIWGRGGYLEVKKARMELEAQRTKIEILQRGNEERLRNIQQLKSSREALEKYARQKGYGRKGEIILQLPPQPPPTKP